ncbi:efflux RND transporter periplasmic adaptor subunit [Mitsuokella sp.]|uniref:efflux RND transporter periplasmic adaptor subunit n=1 Tax=Mitsuokella TaxID=52225 RepID=UPI002A81550B|nr:efflux RND transporter periplasmic adaptor subunit [Mitsuokella sp.]MDY4474688.1 efflux RND transporter periplasmic adaptor subunit [Mitsuokella sp.]
MRHKITQFNRRNAVFSGILCLLVLALALYGFFGQSRDQKAKVAHGKPLVKVVTVNRADMTRHINLSGQTVADANIPLAPKYTGRVTEVRARLGDAVKAGDILMIQDTGDLDISIAEQDAAAGAAQADAREATASYDANYLKARNDLELETSKYERNQYLFSIGAISQDTLDRVKQEYLASQAAFDILADQVQDGDAASVQSKQYTAEKAERAADALRRQRADMFLRAPRDGIIGYRNVEAGAIVSAGTKVFSLVDNSHLNVDCTLSESDAAILKTGLSVQVTIDALGTDCPGRIVYVSPAMDEASRTYQVRIELDTAADDMKAGLFAHTSIDILQRPQTLFVPKEAVLSRNGRQILYILQADGTVAERTVRIGLMNDEEEEILAGLQDGEVVVVTNQDKLKDGTAVESVPYEGSDDDAEAAS